MTFDTTHERQAAERGDDDAGRSPLEDERRGAHAQAIAGDSEDDDGRHEDLRRQPRFLATDTMVELTHADEHVDARADEDRRERTERARRGRERDGDAEEERSDERNEASAVLLHAHRAAQDAEERDDRHDREDEIGERPRADATAAMAATPKRPRAMSATESEHTDSIWLRSPSWKTPSRPAPIRDRGGGRTSTAAVMLQNGGVPKATTVMQITYVAFRRSRPWSRNSPSAEHWFVRRACPPSAWSHQSHTCTSTGTKKKAQPLSHPRRTPRRGGRERARLIEVPAVRDRIRADSRGDRTGSAARRGTACSTAAGSSGP